MVETSILYIEDNPENRLLVKRTLEAAGYHVTEATDGPSGLRAAEETHPDLILLDISLPEIDGYDLARRFLEVPHLEDWPVLAVPANVMKGDRERALGAGCDGYIPKPIDIDELPAQIEEALLRRRSGGDGRGDGAGKVPYDDVGILGPWQDGLDMQELSELDWSGLFTADVAEVSTRTADERDSEVAAADADEGTTGQLELEDEARQEALSEDLLADLSGEAPEDVEEEITPAFSPCVRGDETSEPGPDGHEDDLLVDLLAEMEEDAPPEPAGGSSQRPGDVRKEGPKQLEETPPEAVEPEDQAWPEAVEPVAPDEGGAAGAIEQEGTPSAAEKDRRASEEAGGEEQAPDRELPGEPAGEVPAPELTAESEAAVTEAFKSLVEEIGAAAVFLMSGDAVLTSVGDVAGCPMGRLAETVDHVSQSSDRVASLLGTDGGCREQILDTGDFLLHTLAVNGNVRMVTAMNASVPLGAARLWAKRSARRVNEALAQNG